MIKLTQHLLLTILLLFSTILIPEKIIAQDISESLLAFNQERIDINRKAMYVLSGWALTNITVGSIGYFRSNGTHKYLHQMNAAWNLVNLAIAGVAIYQYGHADPSAFSLSQSISEAQSIENILLLNIGLNIGYMATGGFLWERGIRKASNRLKGYGQSLLIQGGYLLLFDSTLYLLNQSNNEYLSEVLQKVSIQGTSLSISIPL